MTELSVLSRFERVYSIEDGLNVKHPLLILSSNQKRGHLFLREFLFKCERDNREVKFDCNSTSVDGCKIIITSDYRKLAGYDRQCKLLEVY